MLRYVSAAMLSGCSSRSVVMFDGILWQVVLNNLGNGGKR